MINFTARISKEELEDLLDSKFEGSYKPKLKDIKIENGEVIVLFTMEG